MNPSTSEIYLDNNATTRPLPEVIATVSKVLGEGYGNPSSPHQRGAAARDLLNTARHQVAELVGTQAENVFFTSGGTEANNIVLQSIAGEAGQRLITTQVEHSSVLSAAAALSNREVEVDFLPVLASGAISLDALADSLSRPADLVSIQWANSESGSIQPIARIAELCKQHNVPLHVDAAQAVGRIPIDLQKLSVDYLTLTAHKIHGPQGVGAICVSEKSNSLTSLCFGGDQESGLRPGTENLPGIVGLGKACDIRRTGLTEAVAHLGDLRNLFEQSIIADYPEVCVNGSVAHRVANTSNLLFRGVEGMAIMALLDNAGVCCSMTSACTASRPEPSHVLRAMGLSEQKAFSSVRFSFSVLNSERDAQQAASAVCEAYGKLLSLENLQVAAR